VNIHAFKLYGKITADAGCRLWTKRGIRRVKARLNSVKTSIKIDQGYRISARRLLTLVQADHHREASTP
jgi:hypothetical protein